jgi:uncharacterized protein (TIGR03382 family)
VAPNSNCGSVPATGVCAGTGAQICDHGVLKSYDCGVNGCGSYTYQGTAVQFCFLCPPHATADAAGACSCEPGYGANAAGTACVAQCPANSTVNAAGDCVCDAGFQADAAGNTCVAAAGGCGTTGGPPAALVGLLGLAFLSRRRRS